MTNKNQLRLCGYLGILASVMVGVGEFLIHYSPQALEDNVGPYGYLLAVPQYRLTLGHFLMIPFVPLYIFGYWHLYLALKPGSNVLSKLVLGVGVFAFVIAAIWVGSRAHLGMTLQELQDPAFQIQRDNIISSYQLHMENLLDLLRVLIFIISFCFAWAILDGKTLYPKWMAIFNPFLLLLVVFFLFVFVRPIGQYLGPTAMNVAHFVLFLSSMLALRHKFKDSQEKISR